MPTEARTRRKRCQANSFLFDAAPLAGSEETERLVKSAHCTIVVVESGVTTRAQLRTVANILQRLKVPAVGFVLNRVRLATADPEFRRSIRQMGKQLRKQGHATDSQMLQTLEDAIEEGRATLDLDLAATPKPPAARPLEKIPASAPQFDESFRAEKPAPTNQTGPTPAGRSKRYSTRPTLAAGARESDAKQYSVPAGSDRFAIRSTSSGNEN